VYLCICRLFKGVTCTCTYRHAYAPIAICICTHRLFKGEGATPERISTMGLKGAGWS
jgi:hypothetical protein